MKFWLLLFLILNVSYVLTSCVGHNEKEWTFISKLEVPVVIAGSLNFPMKPKETRILDSYFPKQDDGTTFVIKAYEFLPGKGNLLGLDANGAAVTGGTGSILFCNVFSWRELEALNLAIVIDQNVVSGQKLGTQYPECPYYIPAP